MPDYSSPISVTAPLETALERVKLLLFRPFDLYTWFVIGFCAWLDQLGRMGGGGGNGFRGGNRRVTSLQELIEEAKDYFLANMSWLVPLIVGIAVLVIAIWLVFTWLSSRGQFMFLHCVATRRAEVAVPWTRYAVHANSLFIFRVVLGLVYFGLILPIVVAGLWLGNRALFGHVGAMELLVGFVLIAAALVGFAVAFGIIQKLTRDFVVPIMFLHTSNWAAGWRQFWSILSFHPLQFGLYLLFSLLLFFVIALMVLAVVLLTCCCAGCFMLIPYIGTVLLLPIHAFYRCYSAAYLAQFGPEYDVFDRMS